MRASLAYGAIHGVRTRRALSDTRRLIRFAFNFTDISTQDRFFLCCEWNRHRFNRRLRRSLIVQCECEANDSDRSIPIACSLRRSYREKSGSVSFMLLVPIGYYAEYGRRCFICLLFLHVQRKERDNFVN